MSVTQEHPSKSEMSHSITTTASYILNKYSRSYPPTSSLQVGAQAPVESEWQHFTNPVMKIILDAKKSPSGQLVSMRLRILWSLYTDANDLHLDQRDVVFEDLELLSFSSLPTFQPLGAQSDQGLPLKAVYRDSVVGIRYLHPRTVPSGCQPTYRRFQITFKDAFDASRVIDAIKSVCPCKANPHPTQINRHATMLPASLARTATTISRPTAPVRFAELTERQNTISVPVDSRQIPASTMFIHPPESRSFYVAPSSMATNLSSDDSAFVTCSETSHGTDRRKDDLPKSRGHKTAQSSLPNSSQPSSPDQDISMPPPPIPQRTTHSASADATTREPSRAVNTGDERSQLLASLSKHPSLYELSRADLETLVGQVVREEGFLHLLESLDALWRVKGFLGR